MCQCYVLALRLAQRGCLHACAPGTPSWLALSLPGATCGPCGPSCCLVSLPLCRLSPGWWGRRNPGQGEDPCPSGPLLSYEPHGGLWQDLKHGDCDQQHKTLALCLLWPYGHTNTDKSACRLQSLVGLTPFSKVGSSGYFYISCIFVPCHRRHAVIPNLLYLQSFPMPQERNFWKSFQSDPPPH